MRHTERRGEEPINTDEMPHFILHSRVCDTLTHSYSSLTTVWFTLLYIGMSPFYSPTVCVNMCKCLSLCLPLTVDPQYLKSSQTSVHVTIISQFYDQHKCSNSTILVAWLADKPKTNPADIHIWIGLFSVLGLFQKGDQ